MLRVSVVALAREYLMVSAEALAQEGEGGRNHSSGRAAAVGYVALGWVLRRSREGQSVRAMDVGDVG